MFIRSSKRPFVSTAYTNLNFFGSGVKSIKNLSNHVSCVPPMFAQLSVDAASYQSQRCTREVILTRHFLNALDFGVDPTISAFSNTSVELVLFDSYLNSLKLLFDCLRDQDIFETPVGWHGLKREGLLMEERFYDMAHWACERNIIAIEELSSRLDDYYHVADVEASRVNEGADPLDSHMMDFVDLERWDLDALDSCEDDTDDSTSSQLVGSESDDFRLEEACIGGNDVATDADMFTAQGAPNKKLMEMLDELSFPAAAAFNSEFKSNHEKLVEYLDRMLRDPELIPFHKSTVEEIDRGLRSLEDARKLGVESCIQYTQASMNVATRNVTHILAVNLFESAVINTLHECGGQDIERQSKDMFMRNLAKWACQVEGPEGQELYREAVQHIWGVWIKSSCLDEATFGTSEFMDMRPIYDRVATKIENEHLSSLRHRSDHVNGRLNSVGGKRHVFVS